MTARNTDLKAAIDDMGDAQKALSTFLKEKTERQSQEIAALTERLEEIESRASMPGRPHNGNAEAREHKRLFEDWIRHSADPERQRKLGEFEMHAKSVTIGSPAGGGYAVPEEIGREIEKHELKFSPVRSLVKVSRAGTSDIKRLLDLGGAATGWLGESDSRNATNTPTLREIVPTGGEVYAYPKASNWSLDDIFFNVGDWLAESAGEAFAVQEGQAVIRGDGTNKPTGMLNTSPVDTADHATVLRAAAAYQYVESGDNSPASVDADALVDVVYTLNSRYKAGAAWAMNSTTAGQVRKLKDAVTGQYLWQPSLQSGQPNMLLGFPVHLWEDMDDPLGGNFPVAFGDFRRAYELIDRTEVRITRDEVTEPGFTKFYIRKRVYGHVINNDSLKWLRLL